MKILQVHNKYKQYGGEDAVLKLENELLTEYGNEVEQLIFDNNTLNTRWSKLLLIYKTIYNYNSKKILIEKIEKFKPDIIHVHNFFPIASPSIFITVKKLNLPIVFTIHNYRLICANAELFRDNKPCFDCIKKTVPLNGIIHSCYRKSKLQTAMNTFMSSFHNIIGTWQNSVDGYIALTNYSKNLIINSSLKIEPSKIFVKQNFILNNSNLSKDIVRSDRYLYVGRLVDSKGILGVLEICKLNNFKLDIIGDGPLIEKVKKYCAENSTINYLGFKDQEYILQKMSTCRALIFPSLKIEGFPVTIVEAFSVGTPVISSNNGPLNEIIQHNYNGYIYNNLHELTELLIKMNDASQSFDFLYLNTKSSYLKNHTKEINYDNIISIYKTLIDKKNIEIHG